MNSLKRAIRDNQRFHKYEKTLRRISLRHFVYQDEGKTEKAERVIEKIRRICGPWWAKRKKRLEAKKANVRTSKRQNANLDQE